MNVSEMAKIRSSGMDSGDELVPTRRTLLERLRDLDDLSAWQEFFKIYWKLIYCAAVKAGLSDSEAEEVVQETIIGVSRRMPEFRYDPAVCSFKGWLMHVTRRRIIDALRRRGRRIFEPLPGDTRTGEGMAQAAPPAAEDEFAEIWDQEWDRNLVDSALEEAKSAVKPEHYQIFYLHSVKNMPARQVADLMKVSTAKVYVASHRVSLVVKKNVQKLRAQAEREPSPNQTKRQPRVAPVQRARV
jgi:RNA polymerase sigma-70 factor (ECF subfamily)